MWRKASETKMNSSKPQFNGWMADLKIDWIDEAFPGDAAELLLDEDSYDDLSTDESEYSSSSDEED